MVIHAARIICIVLIVTVYEVARILREILKLRKDGYVLCEKQHCLGVRLSVGVKWGFAPGNMKRHSPPLVMCVVLVQALVDVIPAIEEGAGPPRAVLLLG